MTEKEQEIVYSRKYEELLGSNDDELINIWKYNQKEMLSNVSNNKQFSEICEEVHIDDDFEDVNIF